MQSEVTTYYTVAQAAKMTGYSVPTIRNRIREIDPRLKESYVVMIDGYGGKPVTHICEHQVDLWKKEKQDQGFGSDKVKEYIRKQEEDLVSGVKVEEDPNATGVEPDSIVSYFHTEGDIITVSSRKIAEDFGKRHDHVLRDIEDSVRGIPKNGETYFIRSKYQHEQNKQWYPEYLCTRDGFTLLAMGFNGKRALEWKIKYIEAFNKMEEHIKSENNNFPTFNLPKTFSEACRMLADESEKNEQLEHTLSIVKPKADYLDTIIDDEKLISTTVIAKHFGMSGMKLNSILKALGIQFKIGDTWCLKSNYQNEGYAKIITGQNERGAVYQQMKWTQKGRQFIYDQLNKRGLIQQSSGVVM